MLDTVERMASTYFRGARGSHDWDHTLRVRRLCERIGVAEGVDMDVLLVSATLHDIARSHQDDSSGAVCHAEKGAQLAAAIINKLPLTAAQKDNILHCIRSHRLKKNRKERGERYGNEYRRQN
jgi:uncharacterized protein